MTGTATAGPNTTRGTRIPFALQAVFLASNRGKEVHKPPPDHAASKVFFRNWLFQRKSNSSKKNGFDRENDEETKEKRSWTGFAKKSAGKSVRLSPEENVLLESSPSHPTLTHSPHLCILTASFAPNLPRCSIEYPGILDSAFQGAANRLPQQANSSSRSELRRSSHGTGEGR